MRRGLLILGKDVRLLRRSPMLVALLFGYPLLVAALVALALQSGDRKPSVALVNLDTSGRTVQVGDRRLGIEDYADRLARDVDLQRLEPQAAQSALDGGRVSAILTIPANFITDLQTGGVRPPVISLVTSRRDAIQAEAITQRLESAIFRLNQQLSTAYVGQVLDLVRLVTEGGDITLFGRTGFSLGLQRSAEILRQLRREAIARGDQATVRQLDPLTNFVVETGNNLELAGNAAEALRNPIKLRITAAAPGREPLSAFGFAGALLVSLALVGILLAASALSSEREDNALVRLARGLVSPGALVGEKMAFAAAACVAVGLLLLGAVALFTSLAVGRWGLWLLTLVLAGLAFAAFGVLVGALARETRTALLAGLLIALPLLFLGLVPGNDIAEGISEVFAFGPAFEAFQTLLVEPSVPGDLALTLGQLALVAAVFGAVAALALARRTRT
jgi:ABC-type transport system involved in cytochrome c biogenesis permease component